MTINFALVEIHMSSIYIDIWILITILLFIDWSKIKNLISEKEHNIFQKKIILNTQNLTKDAILGTSMHITITFPSNNGKQEQAE